MISYNSFWTLFFYFHCWLSILFFLTAFGRLKRKGSTFRRLKFYQKTTINPLNQLLVPLWKSVAKNSHFVLTFASIFFILCQIMIFQNSFQDYIFDAYYLTPLTKNILWECTHFMLYSAFFLKNIISDSLKKTFILIELWFIQDTRRDVEESLPD